MIKIAREEHRALSNNAFPEIIIYSVPVPDFISDLKDKEVAKRMLISRIRALSCAPISFFCIACNTAHLFIDELEGSTNIPFVSLIKETASAVGRLKVKKIGLLASPVTIKTGLYQKALRNLGVEIILPSESEILRIGRIIRDIIAGKGNEENALILETIANGLVQRGAGALILGCTELPLLFPEKSQVPILDTLEILAKACLKRYYGKIEGR